MSACGCLLPGPQQGTSPSLQRQRKQRQPQQQAPTSSRVSGASDQKGCGPPAPSIPATSCSAGRVPGMPGGGPPAASPSPPAACCDQRCEGAGSGGAAWVPTHWCQTHTHRQCLTLSRAAAQVSRRAVHRAQQLQQPRPGVHRAYRIQPLLHAQRRQRQALQPGQQSLGERGHGCVQRWRVAHQHLVCVEMWTREGGGGRVGRQQRAGSRRESPASGSCDSPAAVKHMQS